jgi:hypothetical protein
MKNQENKVLNITKGEFRLGRHSEFNVETKDGRSIASTAVYSTNMDNGEHIEENKINAVFIAQAFNVSNRTGLTPEQMEEKLLRINELVDRKDEWETRHDKTEEDWLNEIRWVLQSLQKKGENRD